MLWNSQAISTNGEMYNNRVSDRQNVLVFVSYQHYCLTPNNCTASCFAMIQLSQDWLGKPKIYITLNCRCCYTGNNEVQLLLTVVGLMKKKNPKQYFKKTWQSTCASVSWKNTKLFHISNKFHLGNL